MEKIILEISSLLDRLNTECEMTYPVISKAVSEKAPQLKSSTSTISRLRKQEKQFKRNPQDAQLWLDILRYLAESHRAPVGPQEASLRNFVGAYKGYYWNEEHNQLRQFLLNITADGQAALHSKLLFYSGRARVVEHLLLVLDMNTKNGKVPIVFCCAVDNATIYETHVKAMVFHYTLADGSILTTQRCVAFYTGDIRYDLNSESPELREALEQDDEALRAEAAAALLPRQQVLTKYAIIDI